MRKIPGVMGIFPQSWWLRGVGLVLLLVTVLMAILAFSSRAQLLLINVPARLSGMQIVPDIVYDVERGLTMDLYIPRDTGSDRPVLLYLYGGSWQNGDKDLYPFLAQAFVQAGYVVAIPTYRQYPQARFPAFMEDASQATAWISDHIHDYGGDAQRLFLAGHSAGGHVGALLVSDSQYLAAHDLTPAHIKAFVGLAGAYDFTPSDPNIVALFQPAGAYPATHVARFVDGDEPPMLLLYGLADTVVGPENLNRMERALERAGLCHQTRRYQGIDHLGIVGAFAWLWRTRRPILNDMLDFFQNVEKGQLCAVTAA